MIREGKRSRNIELARKGPLHRSEMAYAAVVSVMQILENILGEQYQTPLTSFTTSNMVYAAAVYLKQILDDTLNPHHCVKYQIPMEKKQIESLLKSMRCFHDFLTRSWKVRSPDALCLETEIRDAAHKVEDVIESYISKHFFADNGGEKLRWSELISQHLKILAEEIESIKVKVTRLVDLWDGAQDLHHTRYSPLAQSSNIASRGDDIMVEFVHDSLQLMDRVTGQQRSMKLQIIPVVGMGGIVSQNYQQRDILLGLLESMRRLTNEMHQESDEELSDCLYKCLKGKKYLIVMDDIWHKEPWEKIKRLLPDDKVGSRILLTTRLSDVARYVNSSRHQHHLMRLLNEKESWDLLTFKVFGDKKGCPKDLEEVGKKIATRCKGLPLSIVVISGVLSKVPRTLEEWESIAENLNSVLLANDGRCTELLSLSYDHLPHHLRACFLYTGAFPLDLEIPISKLIKLWIAEGFIKPNRFKSFEQVGEEYLDDLISRNLILVGEKRFDGKIKTCVVHDLLREWCLSKALNEKFIHTLNANIIYCQEIAKDPRRLCIRKDLTDEARAHVLRKIGNLSLVRSLLSQIEPHDELWYCKLLRVLELSKVCLEDFPSEIINLVHLRYVYVCCELREDIKISTYLPGSLRNLQTLIIHQRHIDSSVYLPQGIWWMQHLRHLQFGTRCFFPHPVDGETNSILKNLQTLSYVSGLNCTEEFIKRIPNVKKLGIRFEVLDVPLELASSIRHLMNLHKLEVLKCIVEPESYNYIAKDLTLPRSLKKLTLCGTRISWKDMSIVGSLRNLEVLKLKDFACQGSKWKPIEGEFCQLKSLLIQRTNLEKWKAQKYHFPKLQRLILFECSKLKGIPVDFAYLETLESIELDDESSSVVASALRIQEEKQEFGNEVKVRIHDIWEYIKKKARKEELEAANEGWGNRNSWEAEFTTQVEQIFGMQMRGDYYRRTVGLVPKLVAPLTVGLSFGRSFVCDIFRTNRPRLFTRVCVFLLELVKVVGFVQFFRIFVFVLLFLVTEVC